MNRLTLLAAALLLNFVSFAFAQDKRPPIHRADQISMTIDVLGNIRAAVTKYPLDQRLKLYRTVAVRLTSCGLLYIMINRDTKQDAQTSATFEGVGRVYTLAGSITYPEIGAPYQQMLEQSRAELIKMREANDRTRPPLFLKACQELAGTEQDAAKVVAQLASE